MVGDAAEIDVSRFDWDEANVEHIATHLVKPDDVEAVLARRPRFFENLPGRSATHIMIGEDARGRILYVAIIETAVASVWRVITAWESRFARQIYRGIEGLQ